MSLSYWPIYGYGISDASAENLFDLRKIYKEDFGEIPDEQSSEEDIKDQLEESVDSCGLSAYLAGIWAVDNEKFLSKGFSIISAGMEAEGSDSHSYILQVPALPWEEEEKAKCIPQTIEESQNFMFSVLQKYLRDGVSSRELYNAFEVISTVGCG